MFRLRWYLLIHSIPTPMRRVDDEGDYLSFIGILFRDLEGLFVNS